MNTSFFYLMTNCVFTVENKRVLYYRYSCFDVIANLVIHVISNKNQPFTLNVFKNIDLHYDLQFLIITFFFFCILMRYFIYTLGDFCHFIFFLWILKLFYFFSMIILISYFFVYNCIRLVLRNKVFICFRFLNNDIVFSVHTRIIFLGSFLESPQLWV